MRFTAGVTTIRRFLVVACLGAACSAPGDDAPPPRALANLDDAAYAAAVVAALEARQPAEAYTLARAWQRRSPAHFGPASALARAYLAFGAPAAAVETVERALALAPSVAAARELLAIKVRAHAEAGEPLAALANAAEALRLHGEPDEAFTASLVAFQWAAYATAVAEPALRAAEARAAAPAFPRSPFLTRDILLHRQTALHADFLRRLASPGNDDPGAFAELLRYLALNEYFGPWADPAGVAPPLAEHPELRALVTPRLQGADLPVYGRWVRDNLPASPADGAPSPAGRDATPELPGFLANADAAWASLRPRLEEAVRRADAARSIAEIESAWDGLERLLRGPLAGFRGDIDALAAHLDTHPDAAPAAALARFARWRELRRDPLILAGELRGTRPASGNAVVAEADLEQVMRDQGGSLLEHQMTETEAAPSLFRRWARAVIDAEEARLAAARETLANNTAPRLEEFDVFLAQELMTPELWRARLRAAERAGAWAEQVWSAHHAFAEDPATLDAFLRPRLEECRAALAAAVRTLDADDLSARGDALGRVLDGLAHDPANLPARLALLRTFLRAGLDAAAHEQLAIIWRLHLPNLTPDSDMLALALRVGDWPLLLEIADARVVADDGDVEAHFHRQLAATALGIPQLVVDSATALDGTVFHTRSRLLLWMEPGLLERRSAANLFNVDAIGLKDVVDLLGTADEDPSARVWLGLLLARYPDAFATPGLLSWDVLERGASPTARRHLAFLRGELGEPTYLGAEHDAADAATARFVVRYRARGRFAAGEDLTALAEVARDAALPTLLRAAAVGAASQMSDSGPMTMRAASRRHISPRTRDWAAVWSSLAPGQRAVVYTAPDLASAPAERALRVEALSGAALVMPAGRLEVASLLELRRIHVRGDGAGVAPAWQVRNGRLLAVEEAFLSGQNVNTGERRSAPNQRGHLWIEDVEWKDSVLAAAHVWIDDAFLSSTPLHVGRRLDALGIHAPALGLNLGGLSNVWGRTHAHARFANSVLRVVGGDTFSIVPGSTVHVEDCTLIDRQPDAERADGLASAAVSVGASRLVTSRGDAASAPAGFEARVVDRADAVTRQVSTTAELVRALQLASSGDRIFVRGGVYEVDRTLRVPAGVSLVGNFPAGGSPPTVLRVDARRDVDPVVHVEGGLATFTRLVFEVTHRGTDAASGLRLADTQPRRRAIVASGGAHLVLEGITFPGWDGERRPAVVADRAHVVALDVLRQPAAVAAGGVVSLLGGFGRGGIGTFYEGSGHIHAPYLGDGGFGEGVTVRGGNLHLHHRAPVAFYVRYAEGGGSARELARRDRAQRQLLQSFASAAPALEADLAAAGGAEERAERLVHHVRAHAHLIRAAKLPAPELADAFARYINPALLRHPGELPLLVDLLDRENLWLGYAFLEAHFETFPPEQRVRIETFAGVRRAAVRRGDASETQRAEGLAFLNAFPPGNALHARAMEAARAGVTLAAFRETLAREAELARRMAEIAAAALREREIQEARLAGERAAARWIQQEQERAAAAAAARSAGVSTGGLMGSSWSFSSSASTPYTPSATRQLQDFSRQLDIRIHNTGRDYGEGRRY